MKFTFCTIIIPAMISILKSGSAHSQSISPVAYVRTEMEAKTMVETVLKASPVIDGHNDLFIRFFDCKTCPKDLDDYRIDTHTMGQTDIPRLRVGGTGGLMLNVFGREKTLDSYMQAWDLLYRMQDRYHKDLKIVGTVAEMRKGIQEGKITLLPSLEGAGRLGNNKYLIRTYYQLGLRSVTFAYKTNQLADGSDDTAKYNGISVWGREMIKEMNRLGIIIDMSHISSKAMSDILDVSSAPVIFSHSNARALCDVNRNVPDEILKRLKMNRGIIMLCPVPYFTTNSFNKWMDRIDSLDGALSARYNQHPEDSAELDKVYMQWQKDNIPPAVTIPDFANHFDYIKNLVGVDYIGISGDYDGIEYTIKGLEDISSYPKLLMELARRGWSIAELKKITGENFLRVFEEVEKSAKNKLPFKHSGAR